MLWPVAQSSAEPHGKPNPQLFDLAILLNWIYSVYGLGLLDLIGRASPLTAARVCGERHLDRPDMQGGHGKVASWFRAGI